MKLAIVRQKYTPFGGAERFVARALDALRAQGVAVDIIARNWQGDTAGVKCDPFYLGRTWRDLSFARCVQRVIASGRYDLVQSHERIPGCHIFRAGDGVHATWLELSGKPLTGLSPWHRYTLAAEATMFRHPNLRAVICISRMVRDDIIRHYGVDQTKLHVIYNGLDLEVFHPRLKNHYRQDIRKRLAIPMNAPVFVYVGSGFARKGVATLIESASRMKNREAHFLIVGKDKHLQKYLALTKHSGLAARFHFLGPQKDVRPYLGTADAFVLPTLYEPLSNAVLEALACGLPVVTTTTCGAAELIRPEENGYICEARDTVLLARYLDNLALPGAAMAMSEAARGAVASLDQSKMAVRLVELYKKLEA